MRGREGEGGREAGKGRERGGKERERGGREGGREKKRKCHSYTVGNERN